MARHYDIQVNIELPEYRIAGQTVRGYALGDTAEVSVRLVPRQTIKCRGIWLEFGYREHGQGSTWEHLLINEMVFTRSLQHGAEWTHLFTQELPSEGPVSYAGKYVNYTWFVRYRIDIPIWPDHREEFPFTVLPNLYEAPPADAGPASDWSSVS